MYRNDHNSASKVVCEVEPVRPNMETSRSSSSPVVKEASLKGKRQINLDRSTKLRRVVSVLFWCKNYGGWRDVSISHDLNNHQHMKIAMHV